MSDLELAAGQTHRIKGGRGKPAIDATIIGITKRGRGHTVVYRVGKLERSASAGSFRSKLTS